MKGGNLKRVPGDGFFKRKDELSCSQVIFLAKKLPKFLECGVLILGRAVHGFMRSNSAVAF
jgi:hypothetical protein